MTRGRGSRLALALCAALVDAPALDAQTRTGTVSGRVTDASTGSPVPAVQVRVAGTNLGAMSDAQGAYTIRGVPEGTIELQTLRVGFTSPSGRRSPWPAASAT